MEAFNPRGTPSKLLASPEKKRALDELKQRIRDDFSKQTDKEYEQAVTKLDAEIVKLLGRIDSVELIQALKEEISSRFNHAADTYIDLLEYVTREFWHEISTILIDQIPISSYLRGGQTDSVRVQNQFMNTELAEFSAKQKDLIKLMLLKRRQESHVNSDTIFLANHRQWFDTPVIPSESGAFTSETLVITHEDKENLQQLTEVPAELADIVNITDERGSVFKLGGKLEDLQDHDSEEFNFPVRWEKGVLAFRTSATQKSNSVLSFYEFGTKTIRKVVNLYILPEGVKPEGLVLLKNKNDLDCIVLVTSCSAQTPGNTKIRVSYLYEPKYNPESSSPELWYKQDLFELEVAESNHEYKAITSSGNHVVMLLLPQQNCVFVYPSSGEKLLYAVPEPSDAEKAFKSSLLDPTTRILGLATKVTSHQSKSTLATKDQRTTQVWTLPRYSLQTFDGKGNIRSVTVFLDSQRDDRGVCKFDEVKVEQFGFVSPELEWKLLAMGKFPSLRVFVGVGRYPKSDGKITLLNFMFEMSIIDSSSSGLKYVQKQVLKILPHHLPIPESISVKFYQYTR